MVSTKAAAALLALAILIGPVAAAIGEEIAPAPAIESAPAPGIDSLPPTASDAQSSAIGDVVGAADAAAKTTEDKPLILSGTIAEGPGEVDALTNQIIQKEINFLKLNANLKANETGRGPWATRRWFGDNMAGVTLTAVGAYINGCGRFSYLHKKRLKNAPNDLFEHAGWLRVTANAIMVGTGLFEATAFALIDYRDAKKGTDLRATKRYADKLQDELDALIAKRQQVVAAASLDGAERQLADSEGALIKDVRNLAVNEYIRWYAQGVGNRTLNHAGFAMAITSNALAGAGGIVGNHALMMHSGTARYRTRLGGAGGIADIIAGSMNQSVPLVTRGAAYLARHHVEKNLGTLLDKQEPVELDQLHAHQKQYHELLAAQPQLNVHGTVLRDSIFAKEASILDQHEEIRLGEKKAARQKLMSQLVFFTGAGAPKMVNGIGTTVGAFKYTNNKHERFESIGGPAIAYGVGYSVATAELLHYQLWNEMTRYRNRRLGKQTPAQILQGQVKELEALTVPVGPS